MNQVRARVRVILLDRREALRKARHHDPCRDLEVRRDRLTRIDLKSSNQEAIAARVYV